MRKIGGVTFAETPEEAGKWTPIVRVYPLDRQVLCVARTRIEGAWCAYCGSVPGMDHDSEYQRVLEVGSKLPEYVAVAMFPIFKDIPYAP